MENFDDLFLLDALVILLNCIAWLLTWLLPPLLAVRASVHIPLFDTPSEFSPFFYVSTLLAVFGFGMCVGPRGHGPRLVWAVVIIVVCACVLAARVANHVGEQFGVARDRDLQWCFGQWKVYEMQLAGVSEELRVCKEEVASGLAAAVGVEPGGVCEVGDRCMNVEFGLLAGSVRGLKTA